MEKGNVMNLAPNGKPSNLTPEQYKLVRTSAFKKWFGDWENDPKNASKVVDEETKEPKVMWHGTIGWSGNTIKIMNGDLSSFWLSPSRQFAEKFTNPKFVSVRDNENIKPEIKQFFVNCKKVLDIYNSNQLDFVNKQGFKTWRGGDVDFLERESWEKDDSVLGKLKKIGYTAITNEEDSIIQLGFFGNSNDIKLADGSNTTFDSNNNDIRFDEGGGVNSVKVYHGTTRDFKNFDTKKLGEATKSGSAKNGFWFTDDIATAKSYARAENERKVQEFLDRGDRELALKLENLIFANKDNKYLKEIILTYKNPLIIDADGSMYNDFSDEIMTATQKAKNKGNDILIVKNLSDNADYSEYTPATHYLALDNSIIKSSNSDIRFDAGGNFTNFAYTIGGL